MDKNHKKDVKKSVVRNVKQPLPKTDSIRSKTVSFKKSTTIAPPPTPATTTTPTTLEVPELNSTLEIARKIDAISKCSKQSSSSASTILTNEMITRRVNFPFEQRTYKDLISLETVPKPSAISTTISVREPARLKDKEPKLCDFIEPRSCKEYLYEPKRKYDNRKVKSTDFNPMKLHKMLTFT